MNERDRLEKALRRPSPPPPPELARSIKDQIPEQIGSGSNRQRRTPLWLAAAAVMLLAASAGMIALLSGPPAGQPSAVVAEQSATYSIEEPAPDASELKTASATADGRLDDATRSTPEERIAQMAESEIALTQRDVPAAVEATPPPPPASARVAPATSSRELEASTQREVANLAPGVGRSQTSKASPEMTAAAPQAASDVATERAPARRERQAETLAFRDAMETEGVAEADARSTFLSFEEIASQIDAGRLPDPARVSVDAVVNAFDFGDRPPWRRGDVSVLLEGGAAPFAPGRWRTVRVALRSRPGPTPSSTDGTLILEFNPEVVSLYRRVGEGAAFSAESTPRHFEAVGALPSDHARSWLFEVKLRPELELEREVVEATLELDREGADVRVSKVLEVGHLSPTWRTTSTSLQLATVAAAWGEWLANPRSDLNVVELGQRADDLVRGGHDDPEIDELVRLIDRSISLRTRQRR